MSGGKIIISIFISLFPRDLVKQSILSGQQRQASGPQCRARPSPRCPAENRARRGKLRHEVRLWSSSDVRIVFVL